MNKGSLIHEDYFKLFKNNNIIYNDYSISQIQPSSLDLTFLSFSEQRGHLKLNLVSHTLHFDIIINIHSF